MAKEISYGICPYKRINNKIFIFLNKPYWTSPLCFFKGKIEEDETKEDCACREFFEETNFKVNKNDLENFFFQLNKRKNVGIFLVNWKNKKENFKFQKEEIRWGGWLDISTIKIEEMAKNQREIFMSIKEYFKI